MHAYYSDRAAFMPKNLEDMPPGQVRDILDELKLQTRDKTVLEIACGTGNWVRVVAPHARAVTAVDYSEAMLRAAKLLPLTNARFVHEDACSAGEMG